MNKPVIILPPPSPPGHRGEIALPGSEKAEAFAESLKAQFKPVTIPSVPAVIEIVDVGLRSYFMTPVSEPKLPKPGEVQESIRDLKVGKAPGPNGIPNKALKHLAKRAVSLLVQIFNGVLSTLHFPSAWKHAAVISTLKPGKNPAQPSSFRPNTLLDTTGKPR
jgi:hypothetical protein